MLPKKDVPSFKLFLILCCRDFRHLINPSRKVSVMTNGIRTFIVIFLSDLTPPGDVRLDEGKEVFVDWDDINEDDLSK